MIYKIPLGISIPGNFFKITSRSGRAKRPIIPWHNPINPKMSSLDLVLGGILHEAPTKNAFNNGEPVDFSEINPIPTKIINFMDDFRVIMNQVIPFFLVLFLIQDKHRDSINDVEIIIEGQF